ncbi:DUF3048 domain-containing protein [Candidatus Saccharibacteria bacterium]|nr:DUF3048 domain-containing protein [Candidatus Saccharibacteria bacterium]
MDNPEALAQKLAKSRVEKLELPKPPEKETKSKNLLIIIFASLGAALIGLVVVFFTVFDGSFNKLLGRTETSAKEEEIANPIPTETKDQEPETPKYYSRLTGEQIANENENSNPTFCVQIPNGVDGARPQAGLNSAKIVFEAIAESGITRFAAIFQNPPAVVGPIRSLRIYYLEWDLPFDCTVVHAGGAPDALEAVKALGVRDLSENYNYMWRSSTNYTVQRLWNNLFTSSEYLNGFNGNNGYLSSDIRAFPRFTPVESARNKIDVQATEKLKIDQPSTGNTDGTSPRVTKITMKIGAMPNFNPVYTYDSEKNVYTRAYETGAAHTSFDCSDESGELTPELVCEEVGLAPSVVIGIMVQERKAAYDNYHEDISTVGAGDAYIFQNGGVIVGTWEKSSRESQIIFRDKEGNEVKLAPGQTWITALPASYGASVIYE